MRSSMRPRACAVLIMVLSWFGCGASDQDGDVGQVELRLSTFSNADVTRIALEADGTTTFDIPKQSDGSYNGALVLTAGEHSLVARGYAGNVLVAQSQPLTVSVQAGAVTRAMMRLLDVTTDPPPVYGPILDGVSYPTSVTAGMGATLAMNAYAPGGDPLTFAWTSDCSDASFSAQAATTIWTKPTQGSCNLTATVTSNQISASASFAILVLPAAPSGGAIIDFALVRKPFLEVGYNSVCSATSQASPNASCAAHPAAPTQFAYGAQVWDWGGSSPAGIALSDDCSGHIATTGRSADQEMGVWVPPTGGGLCRLTVKATNGDGLIAIAKLALVAHAGTPNQDPAPYVTSAGVFTPGATCVLASPASDCGTRAIGASLTASAQVYGTVGLTFVDDCVGPRPWTGPSTLTVPAWAVPNLPGATCTVTLSATSLSGANTTLATRYKIAGP